MKYLKISKFILTGGMTTGLHLGIVMLLVHLKLFGVEISNGIAYTVSTIFNFSVNTVWSFQESLSRKIFKRYFLVSAIGLLLAMFLAYINDICGRHYLIGIGMIVCICPTVTYLMHVNYTYKIKNE